MKNQLEEHSDTNLSAAELNQVLLVGGSIRMPAVQELVAINWQNQISALIQMAVSIGAAYQGGVVSGDVKTLFCSTLLH